MASENGCTREELAGFEPRHDSFVGIDSDGCVFDTMEIKQKQCFHPLIVSHWKLEAIEQPVRRTAEFVNLYSRWRGQNRFIALLKTFDLLPTHPEVRTAGVSVPRLPALEEFIASGKPLGNPGLAAEVDRNGDPELASLLQWSTDVNDLIARTVRGVPPFPGARESLARICRRSDAICVSQTPFEALAREWEEHGARQYVRLLAGQELGTKTEHLALAAKGRYPKDRVLMIGDAPGDHKAAAANGALFYPINPTREADSWTRFQDEAFDRFLAGNYAGDYQDELTAEFEALLPERPPWAERDRP